MPHLMLPEFYFVHVTTVLVQILLLLITVDIYLYIYIFLETYHYVADIAGVFIESKSSCGCRLTAVLLLVMD